MLSSLQPLLLLIDILQHHREVYMRVYMQRHSRAKPAPRMDDCRGTAQSLHDTIGAQGVDIGVVGRCHAHSTAELTHLMQHLATVGMGYRCLKVPAGSPFIPTSSGRMNLNLHSTLALLSMAVVDDAWDNQGRLTSPSPLSIFQQTQIRQEDR